MVSIRPLLCAVLLGLPLWPATAQPPVVTPLQVTSDTPEFCDHLARHFARARQGPVMMPAERVMLADEGERMCAMGLIKAGIARLRMALRPERGPK